MKNLVFVIPLGLLLSVSCGSSVKKESKLRNRILSMTSDPSTARQLEKNSLDEYWPFVETLKTEDPFVSELLAIKEQ